MCGTLKNFANRSQTFFDVKHGTQINCFWSVFGFPFVFTNFSGGSQNWNEEHAKFAIFDRGKNQVDDGVAQNAKTGLLDNFFD